VITLFYTLTALILVTLIGDNLDLNGGTTTNIEGFTSDTKLVSDTRACAAIKDNYGRKSILCTTYKYEGFNKSLHHPKSFLHECIENRNNKIISREKFIQNTYEDIIQEVINHNLITKNKFSNLNGVKNFVENYLIHQIVSGNLKITNHEFNKLMYSVNNISDNNPKLYSLLCNQNNRLRLNRLHYNPNIKYNKVSEKYLNNYTS
jgi:hypothetical protein